MFAAAEAMMAVGVAEAHSSIGVSNAESVWVGGVLPQLNTIAQRAVLRVPDGMSEGDDIHLNLDWQGKQQLVSVKVPVGVQGGDRIWLDLTELDGAAVREMGRGSTAAAAAGGRRGSTAAGKRRAAVQPSVAAPPANRAVDDSDSSPSESDDFDAMRSAATAGPGASTQPAAPVRGRTTDRGRRYR